MFIIKELNRLKVDVPENMNLFAMDFGAYFPYHDQDELRLGVSLSTEPMNIGVFLNMSDQSILNNRYPNKDYLTMSKKCGRKICRFGYFSLLSQEREESAMFQYLNIIYGFRDKKIFVCIPISMNISKEKPCVAFNAALMLEQLNDPELSIRIYEKIDGGYITHKYGYGRYIDIGSVGQHSDCDRFYPLTLQETIESSEGVKYIILNETVHMIPCMLEEALLI